MTCFLECQPCPSYRLLLLPKFKEKQNLAGPVKCNPKCTYFNSENNSLLTDVSFLKQ